MAGAVIKYVSLGEGARSTITSRWAAVSDLHHPQTARSEIQEDDVQDPRSKNPRDDFLTLLFFLLLRFCEFRFSCHPVTAVTLSFLAVSLAVGEVKALPIFSTTG